MSIGYAKNETLELIIGNSFIAIGGFFAGYRIDFQGVQINGLISATLIGIGIVFDLRVLRKFGRDLSITRNNLELTRELVDESTEKMKEAEKELEEMQKKVFSFISDARWSHPLEDRIKELEKAVKELRQQIRVIENSLR